MKRYIEGYNELDLNTHFRIRLSITFIPRVTLAQCIRESFSDWQGSSAIKKKNTSYTSGTNNSVRSANKEMFFLCTLFAQLIFHDLPTAYASGGKGYFCSFQRALLYLDFYGTLP